MINITSVGELKELVQAAERHKTLRENLKQLLRLTKGWDTMRDHVMLAVDDDKQLRVWYADNDGNLGIIFQCGSYNSIDLNNPLGVLRRCEDPSETLVNIHWSSLRGPEAPTIQACIAQAVIAWSEAEHPGWFLLPEEIVPPPQQTLRDGTAGVTSCRGMVPHSAACGAVHYPPQCFAQATVHSRGRCPKKTAPPPMVCPSLGPRWACHLQHMAPPSTAGSSLRLRVWSPLVTCR